MEFDPNNTIIRLCMQGMNFKEKNQTEAADRLFFQAWNEAINDFERFIAAWYIARHQENITERLRWYETAFELASGVDSKAVQAALPSLCTDLAKDYEASGNAASAIKYQKLTSGIVRQPVDNGPFYHGTRADLKVGDMLTAGRRSNYDPELIMNHVYFTSTMNGAGLAAALANGEGSERIYIIEPTGDFEDDPNVTNKRFPGNPTCSYRTTSPLTITGEVTEWLKQSPAQIQQWREKLSGNPGAIIN